MLRCRQPTLSHVLLHGGQAPALFSCQFALQAASLSCKIYTVQTFTHAGAIIKPLFTNQTSSALLRKTQQALVTQMAWGPATSRQDVPGIH